MHEPFVLISANAGPGSSWPAHRYGDLARTLDEENFIPVLAGFDVEAGWVTDLTRTCGSAINLMNQISAEDLVFLSWAATATVGPDNGIMHLTAAAACHSVVIHDGTSDPALTGQRGDSVVILRPSHLKDISAGEIMTAIRKSPKIGGI
jgi:ADP-heptose:LPS heptosyltransferase